MRAKFGVLQQTHGLRLPAKFRLDRFILSSYGGEKPQFLPFFGFRHLVMSPTGINLRIGSSLRKLYTGAHTFPILPMRAKFGVLEQTQGLHCHAKYHLNVLIVSASGSRKNEHIQMKFGL